MLFQRRLVMGMKKRKIALAAAVLILGIVLIGSARAVTDLVKYKKIIKEMTINEVDMTRIPDGIYRGSFDALLVSADVSVAVKDHKIIEIKLLEHNNSKGRAAEVIPDKIIQAQSLLIDAVSGATASSKVILKAVENALQGAQ